MKKILLYPFRFLDGLVDRVVSLAGAVGLAQFPQFFAQYLQRLGGHLEEARLVIARYRAAAETLDLTLEEYLAEHLASGNEIFVSSGQVMTGVLQRLGELEEAFLALQQAGPFTRWWFFLLKADPLIIRETFRYFQPGLPTTVEGLIYGLAGLFLAWGLYRGLMALVRCTGRKIGALVRKPAAPVKPGRTTKPGLPL
ncbi:MAG: DUF2937 family protein [Firmicutes bacterium]|nr:DUF2937 family protein [Bacillota bacterium]